MQYVYILLARLIREGRVQVDMPAVDMDRLAKICQDHNPTPDTACMRTAGDGGPYKFYRTFYR